MSGELRRVNEIGRWLVPSSWWYFLSYEPTGKYRASGERTSASSYDVFYKDPDGREWKVGRIFRNRRESIRRREEWMEITPGYLPIVARAVSSMTSA